MNHDNAYESANETVCQAQGMMLAVLTALVFAGCAAPSVGGDTAEVSSSTSAEVTVDAQATAPQEVKHDGKLVGVSLFDGKVLVNGNISGSAKYILENCPVEEGIKYETRMGANSALVKWVFPKAIELRVQIDFGYGFPKGSKVRLYSPTDTTIAAIVDAPDGKWYFLTEMSTPYSRPSFFTGGTIRPWSGNVGEIVGEAPAGYSHECFYGIEGDDIQTKVAVSRKSIADAEAILAAEQPGFMPMKRPLIWQFDEATFPARKPMKGDKKAPSLKYIQRTMRKLEESTAEKPATVRVLFYGQSIIWQFWSRLMMKDLQAKYPTVKFVWRNLAIGGFESDKLIDSFERDVCSFYPDLLFFHVYGDVRLYAEMVKCAREKTAAEIVLWTSHLASYDKEPAELLEKRDARSLGILDTAAKYHCHIIDLNDKWCRHLVDNGLAKKEYLADGIHLNGKGQMQYKDYIEEELIRIKGAKGDEEATGSERFFALDDASVSMAADGTLEFAFDGNRVVAVSDGSADEKLNAEIRLDGNPPAKLPELWTATRPTPLIMWFPGLHSFRLGPKAPVEEDWTLEILPPRQGDPTNEVLHAVGELERNSKFIPFRFRVTGSVTGQDGEGLSTEPFVSKSGRLSIPVRAWALWPHWKGSRPQVGAKTFWSVHPLFTDRLTAKAAGEETLILQGCANGPHKLTIKLPKGAKSGIKGFKVWKPAAAKSAGK